jgi:hypothetical protein
MIGHWENVLFLELSDDPFLGLFDSNCNLLAFNDDTGSTNSRLIFTVPVDGIFVLAATNCCDSQFIGGGTGTYEMTIAAETVAGSISGRIVDAQTGQPLSGVSLSFAYVSLNRCIDGDCFETVNGMSVDDHGRFQFNTDFNGNPLIVATYQVVAYAEQYQQGQTAPFDVGEGEDKEIGDIALQPLPVQFSEIRPCGELPAEGGKCTYGVRINNITQDNFRGAAWSLVDSFGIGSPIDSTLFQSKNPKKIKINPGKSKVVSFNFDVPHTVKDGTYICTQIYVGQNLPSQKGSFFFNTVGQKYLFCISKGLNNTFNVLSGKKAHELLQNKQEMKSRKTVSCQDKKNIFNKLRSLTPAKKSH